MSSALPPISTEPVSPTQPISTSLSLPSLPLELIEQIIVHTTLSGHPTTVSSLARTCRFLRECVYQPLHSHLWMRMFLAAWDDPRGGVGWSIGKWGYGDVEEREEKVTEKQKGNRRGSTRAKGKGEVRASTSSKTASKVDEFPWEEEYKRRIWTGLFLRRHASRMDPRFDRPSTTNGDEDNDADHPAAGRRATLRSSSLATRHSSSATSKSNSNNKSKGKSKATTPPSHSAATPTASQPPTSSDLTTALQCLLSVLSTSAPLPSPSSLSSFTSSDIPDLRTPYPVFPPHSMSIVAQTIQQSHPFATAHAQLTTLPSSATTMTPTTSTFVPSLNLLWLAPLIRHAITIMRPRALSIFKEDGVDLTIAERPKAEDELFWRLVAQTGLMEGFGGGDGSEGGTLNGGTSTADEAGSSAGAGAGGWSAMTIPPMPEDAEAILQAHGEATYEETGKMSESGSSDTHADMETEQSVDEDGDHAHVPANDGIEPDQEEPEEESLAAQFEFNASSSSSSHPHPSSSDSSSPHTSSAEETRRLARIKVYNMRYVHPQRLWGPFVHLRDPGASMFAGEGALEGRTHVWIESRDDDDEDEDEEGTEDGGGGVNGGEDDGGEESGAGGVGNGGGLGGHTHSLQLIELAEIDEDDVEDPDYVDASDMFQLHDDDDPMERDSEVSSSTSSRNEDDGHGADDGQPGSGKQPSKKRNFSAMDLKFDWNWLSAARQVVEGNLRDLLLKRHIKALRALVGLDGLRMGSAPGMDVERMLREREMGQRTGSGEEDGKWDWAGVEGQWRRCVCWIDYRDLIANNVRPITRRFDDPDLFEVMRIIPFTLRITSFGTVPPNSRWPHRPPINVVGQLAGSSNQLSDGLRIRGRVEMVGDGNVRWSIRTRREDDEGEWQSEGVQLGGLGSATGVLGMWTSAEHEHMDPLGPFWSWKVGSKDALDEQGKLLPLS